MTLNAKCLLLKLSEKNEICQGGQNRFTGPTNGRTAQYRAKNRLESSDRY